MTGEIEKNPRQVKKMDSNGHDLNFYRFVINSIPVAVLTVDAEFKITGFSAWAEQLTGYSEKEAMGHYCGEILQGGMCKINCPLRAVIKKHQTVVRVDTTITDRSGKTIPVAMNTAGLFDDDGRLLGGLEAFQDISRLKALEREKANLISMFAHDIKSSLTIIGGFVLRLLKKRSSLDPDQISGGQKQRVAVVRALVTEPKLILADEPTANLDHKTAYRVIDIMKEMKDEFGTTFIFSTHDQKIVGEVEVIYMLEDGELADRLARGG